MGRRKQPPLNDAIDKPIGYSFADVLLLSAASKSNLTHWTKIGAIKPDVAESVGRGHHRRFSAWNVIEVEIATVIHGFGKTAETIYGALDAVRSFHQRMRAVHEVVTRAPLTVDPPHLALWPSEKHRLTDADVAVLNHARWTSAHPVDVTQAEADVATEHILKVARIWSALRTGSLIRGIPWDGSPMDGGRFLGLFIWGLYEGGEARGATVALDPPDLRDVINRGAIVIDLVDVIWQVGQRCKRHGVTLEAW